MNFKLKFLSLRRGSASIVYYCVSERQRTEKRLAECRPDTYCPAKKPNMVADTFNLRARGTEAGECLELAWECSLDERLDSRDSERPQLKK